MHIEQAQCGAFWRAFVASLAPQDARRHASPDAFGFGGAPALADELAALVLAGRKRATTSLPIEYTALGEALPRAGDLSIIVDGRGEPVAIIERRSVEARAFSDVDADYAAIEGEGDGSLAQWRRDHRDYFAGVSARHGLAFDDATLVLCQCFHVVWPPAADTPSRR